jgi:mannose-6-phosphate isomerase-like protein (cupin superfamily)
MQTKIVALEGDERFKRLLAGKPETAGMKSGYMKLEPGESVGEHVTSAREECIIVLEGTAEVIVKGAAVGLAEAKQLIYIPPETPHDIRNAGQVPLRYVYVVANILDKGRGI